MSGALFPIAMGAQAVGLGLEGIGRSQGMEAMSEEQQRQVAEWMAGNARQQGFIDTEKANRAGRLMGSATAPGLAVRGAATQGAGALGAGMGLGTAGTAQATGALMPSAVVDARQSGERRMDLANATGAHRMGADINQSRMDQALRAALYEQQLVRAGRKGQYLRQAGQFLQQGGAAASGMGLYGGGGGDQFLPGIGYVPPTQA